MKRDPIEALGEIRKLCVEADLARLHHDFLLARIERICRHALEDYDAPEVVGDIAVGSVKVTGHAAEAPPAWTEVAQGVLVRAPVTVQGCKLCQVKPVAYPGAVFCGAACSQRWESGERP